MQILFFLLIGLGWLGWSVAWARDRQIGGGGLPSFGAPVASARLAAPRNERMARRRRREVLAVLASAALITFVLARAWAILWPVHVVIDVALIAYGYAVVSKERPDVVADLGAGFRPVPVERDDTAEFLAS